MPRSTLQTRTATAVAAVLALAAVAAWPGPAAPAAGEEAGEPAPTRPAPTQPAPLDLPLPIGLTSDSPFDLPPLEVTAGAAPGYVADRACALCHAELYRSYQEVGMAKSFFRPTPERRIEDFSSGYYHPRSRRHYRIVEKGDRLVFRRHQLDADGEPIHEIELPIDWVLGSGHHSRTYLYRTESGELFQLPLAWYTDTGHQEGGWAMAPGYDNGDHYGIVRPVRRECMFCHNAYPDVSAGSDGFDAQHVFPAELPEGTGCQRCHGPGARHVRTALEGSGDPAALRASIVNPGRLSAERRDDVCYGCHLQPSVAVFGVRRFDRGDYSFRPGERLADFLIKVDVDEEGQSRSERFEINHHPYRLEQSACFRESAAAGGGALSCLTCHDPHVKVPTAERATHYRTACLGCHDGATVVAAHPADSTDAGAGVDGGGVLASDCASCHMPKRRTQDVVRVVMTDHLIRRPPAESGELLVPLEEREPVITEIEILEESAGSDGERLDGIYRAVAARRAGAASSAVDYLARQLEGDPLTEIEPYLELGRGQLRSGQSERAITTFARVLERSPGHPLAREWTALALSRLGRREEAIETLEEIVAERPDRPEARFNLGFLLLEEALEVNETEASGPAGAAVGHLRAATRLRATMAPAWFHLGNALQATGELDEAIDAYRRALAIDPKLDRAYLALTLAALAENDRALARRYLAHGAGEARDPARIRQALEQLGSAPRGRDGR